MRSRIVLFCLISFIAGGSFLLESCRKHKPFFSLTPLSFIIPQGFPQPAYDFRANPLTEEGFVLGKKLFYDGRLSFDGNFSCASCHQAVAAFTTFEHDRSHGYNGSHTLRNAPGLFNLAWYQEYNQDGSSINLEKVYRDHITSPIEMADNIGNVINKLNQDPDYKNLFAKAFGDGRINEDKIYKALSQFLMTMVSADSKYDKVKRGEASFTPEEANGYKVFQANCSSCHKEPLFTDLSYRNIGLDADPILKDYGRMRVTRNPADSLKFRVPSLRNAEFTSYYTHDGRFSVFRMMIWHYRSGIKQSATLDPSLTNGISLTDAQENQLVAFIRTLSDSTFLNNPRFRQ